MPSGISVSYLPGVTTTLEHEEGLYIEGGILQTQEIAAVLKCDTNVCGTSWTDLHFLPRGCFFDDLAWEYACSHAESMLGEDDWDEEDGDEKYCNAGVEGSFYMYWPGRSCNLVNGGSPFHSVIERAIYLGYIQIADEKAIINLRDLKTFIYIPDAETILYVEEGLKSGWKVSGVVYL